MNPEEGDLTRRPVPGTAFRFGLPLALAMMGHGLFNLVDLIIVGQLSAGAIAAVTVPGVVFTVLMLTFDGVSNTTVALTSQGRGSGRYDIVRQVTEDSLWISLLAGVVGGGGLALLAPWLMGGFAIENADTVRDGVDYLQVLAGGSVTMFIIMQTTSVLRGIGNALWPVAILVGSNVLNLVLDLALVYGWWGFPEMGVVGAAWATNIARGIGAALGLWLLWRGVGGLRMWEHRFRFSLPYARTLVVVGTPTALQLAVRVLAVFFLLHIARASYEGSAEALIDGVGVCVRLEMVAVFLGLGWGAAATTLVGQNLGARRVRRAHESTLWLLLYAVGTMTLAGGLMWVFREQLFDAIAPKVLGEARERGFEYLAITIAIYPVSAFSFVISRALNGAGSTKSPMLIDAVLFIGVLLPLAAWWSAPGGQFDQNLKGAWWASVVVQALAAVAYGTVWFRGHWRRKRFTDGETLV